jgi:hypothetical protein
MTLAREMPKVYASALIDLPAWCWPGRRRALFIGRAGRATKVLPSAFVRAKRD